MSLLISHLEDAVAFAMADPAVRADAAGCRIGLRLEITPDVGGPHFPVRSVTLRVGDSDAGQIICRANWSFWQQVLTPIPTVGYQSFGALRRQKTGFEVVGHELHWMQALPLLERLLEVLRQYTSPRSTQVPPHFQALVHLTGRYLQLDSIPQTWVYSEECGNAEAPPMLMLHTAGSDARQWHGLMAQSTFRADWRLLGFDLPGHGRSPLPAGDRNWTWTLSEDKYIHWVLRYLDAQQLDRVALMGCSMGSAIGLALLAKHSDRFFGGILLETPYCSPGRRSPYLNNAEVHGARLSAAWVSALLSPTSPAEGRDHATWIYSQAAPSVYDGDLAFYSDQFNAHNHTGQIDTKQTPLWMMTGDYDYSATPADSHRVADEIAGANFQVLKGFGHFPMVENPAGLMPHLKHPLTALHAHIRERSNNQ